MCLCGELANVSLLKMIQIDRFMFLKKQITQGSCLSLPRGYVLGHVLGPEIR